MEIFIYINIIGLFLVGASGDSKAISSIFEGFGYSPVCVASALASCELSSQEGFDKNVTSPFPHYQHSCQMDYCKYINDSIGLIISSLQEIDKNSKQPSHRDAIRTSGEDVEQTDTCKNVTESLAQIAESLNEIKPKKTRPLNCYEIRESGDTASGVRTIYPLYHSENKSLEVYCDQSTDGGGWTVFQRRDDLPNREDFYRNWTEYVLGFGNLNGEFWLGLDNIHALTAYTPMEIRFDLEDYAYDRRWAKYKKFIVGDSSTKYTIEVRSYSGNAGDEMQWQNKMKFSTKDQDNDPDERPCATLRRGAWWHKAGCLDANLNGFQYVGQTSSWGDGINWNVFKGYHYSLKRASMKVRPV